MNFEQRFIAALDTDGAIQETAERATRLSRGALLRRAALAGAAGVVTVGRPMDSARGASASDTAILNYALTLEYLQDAFYTESERKRVVRGEALQIARLVGAVERSHVRALQTVLGRAAVKRPNFDFKGATEDQARFVETAAWFEDLGTAAYNGAAVVIQSDSVLATALSLHSVEARHAAWIRYIADERPVQQAFDDAKTRQQVLREIRSRGFVVAAPRTEGRSRPRFAG